MHVESESESVSPNAQVEEEPQRKEDADYHVKPFAAEWAGVCAWIYDGVVVDVHE